MNGACSLKMRRSESVPSSSPDLKLELDGKGEPVLLGQGSFAKVLRYISSTENAKILIESHGVES